MYVHIHTHQAPQGSNDNTITMITVITLTTTTIIIIIILLLIIISSSSIILMRRAPRTPPGLCDCPRSTHEVIVWYSILL